MKDGRQPRQIIDTAKSITKSKSLSPSQVQKRKNSKNLLKIQDTLLKNLQ